MRHVGEAGSRQKKFLLFPPVASIDRRTGAPRGRGAPTYPVAGDEPVGDISTVNTPERQHSRSSFAYDLRNSQSGTAGALHIVSLAGVDFRNSWHIPPVTRGILWWSNRGSSLLLAGRDERGGQVRERRSWAPIICRCYELCHGVSYGPHSVRRL
jgi:hypothetical protein